MGIDIRSDAASFYDYNPVFPKDIPFYIEQIPSPDAAVLELGCGTGRVSIPLSRHCKYIHGIDLSEAMIAIYQEKLAREKIPSSKITVEVGDITSFDLNRKFDLVIAPFRVFQNLETDEEIAGLFDCVRKHLAPHGRCILNVFKPFKDWGTLVREWCSDQEKLSWEVAIQEGKAACFDRRLRLDEEKRILYPELIYRKYENDVVALEAVLNIAMRCYYPQDFEKIITDHGFRIVNQWGGYTDEPYGMGPELVIKFEDHP